MTETDDDPRWSIDRWANTAPLRFLGRAGPIDIWLDTFDGMIPFLMIYSRASEWSSDAEHVIERAQAQRVHLTLHDKCRIHALCAPHNKEET